MSEPTRTLFVPVRDLGAKRVRRVWIALIVVAAFVFQDLRQIEGGVVVLVVVVLVVVGLDFFEDAVGLDAPAARVELVADLVEVLFGGTELAGADGAAEDDDGEEEAEEGEGSAAARALDLTESASSQAPVQHCCIGRPAPNPIQSNTLSRRVMIDNNNDGKWEGEEGGVRIVNKW